MSLRSLALLGIVAAAATAGAQSHVLYATYDYSLDGVFGSSAITHIIMTAEGGGVDDDYNWGVGTYPWNSSMGAIQTFFDTSWYGEGLSQPYLRESFGIGIAQDLPGDAPGQKHLVLFMDSTAASNAAGIAWGTIFTSTLEEQIIYSVEEFLDFSNPMDVRIYHGNIVGEFLSVTARSGNLGPNGTPGTAWFGPGDFSIMAFSDGQQMGTGYSSYYTEAVPEPGTLAALGLGALALSRRRRSG